jgi:hypothetical protein
MLYSAWLVDTRPYLSWVYQLAKTKGTFSVY